MAAVASAGGIALTVVGVSFPRTAPGSQTMGAAVHARDVVSDASVPGPFSAELTAVALLPLMQEALLQPAEDQ